MSGSSHAPGGTSQAPTPHTSPSTPKRRRIQPTQTTPTPLTLAERVSQYAHLVARESQLFFQHLHPLAAEPPGQPGTWTQNQVDALLSSLSRHSRLRPDLIAADLAPHKSLPEILHLVSLFEDVKSRDTTPCANPHKRTRGVWEKCPAAVEMSGQWIEQEERLAKHISHAEHFVTTRMAVEERAKEEHLDAVPWEEQMSNAMLWLYNSPSLSPLRHRSNALVHFQDERGASSSTSPESRQAFIFSVQQARQALRGQLRGPSATRNGSAKGTLQSFGAVHPVPRILRRRTGSMLALVLRQGVQRGFLGVLKRVDQGQGSGSSKADTLPAYRLDTRDHRHKALLQADRLVWLASPDAGDIDNPASRRLGEAREKCIRRLLSQLGGAELRWLGEHFQRVDGDESQASHVVDGEQASTSHLSTPTQTSTRTLFMGVDLSPFSVSDRHKIKMRMRLREAKYGRQVAVRTAFDAKWGIRKRFNDTGAEVAEFAAATAMAAPAQAGEEIRKGSVGRPHSFGALGVGEKDLGNRDALPGALKSFAEEAELLDLGRLATMMERRSLKTSVTSISRETLVELVRLLRAWLERLLLRVIEEGEATHLKQRIVGMHVRRALSHLSPDVARSLDWQDEDDEDGPTLASIEAACDHTGVDAPPHHLRDLLDGVDFAGASSVAFVGASEGSPLRISPLDAFASHSEPPSHIEVDRLHFAEKVAPRVESRARRSGTADVISDDVDLSDVLPFSSSSSSESETHLDSDMSSLYEDEEEEAEAMRLRSRLRSTSRPRSVSARLPSDGEMGMDVDGDGDKDQDLDAWLLDVQALLDVDEETKQRALGSTGGKARRKLLRREIKDELVTRRMEGRDRERAKRAEEALWGWGLGVGDGDDEELVEDADGEGGHVEEELQGGEDDQSSSQGSSASESESESQADDEHQA